MSNLYTPTGKRIIGTLETLEAVARIVEDSVVVDGSFEYYGTTDLDWDSQKTVTKPSPTSTEGIKVFVDEDGQRWLETELEIKP